MRTTTSARLKKSAALVAVASVAALGTTAVPAGATTGPITYTCDTAFTDPFPLEVEIDSLAGAKVWAGEPVDVVSSTTLAGDLAKLAYDMLGARSFNGTIAASMTIDNAASTLVQTIPDTVIPDQTTPTAVPFAATGKVTLSTPGDVVLRAGDFEATINPKDEAGQPTAVPSVAVTCAAPKGPGPVIDTVVVAARSTTALTLSKTASTYGERVTATAKVTTTGGSPSGDVSFVVDGLATKARVNKDGVATLPITNAKLGSHTVTASFVPSDSIHYEPSTSAPQAWTVGKAGSRIGLAITGKRTSRATKVAVRVRGEFGTEATGKVRIRLMKLGTKKRWLKVRTLRGGKTAAGFGRLAKGRYKVAVTYRGDANHLKSKKVRKFRVRRG